MYAVYDTVSHFDCLQWVMTAKVCVCVGSCLATKVFIGKMPAWEGVGHHKVGKQQAEVNYQQISYRTLIGVHSTMHLVHPN